MYRSSEPPHWVKVRGKSAEIHPGRHFDFSIFFVCKNRAESWQLNRKNFITFIPILETLRLFRKISKEIQSVEM